MILCVLKFSHPCKTPKLCPCSISKPKPAIRNLPFNYWLAFHSLELNFTKIIIKRAEMRNKRERKILFYSALSSQRSFHFHTFPFIIILVIHEWEKDFLLVLSVPLLLLMFVFVCVPKKKKFFFLFSLLFASFTPFMFTIHFVRLMVWKKGTNVECRIIFFILLYVDDIVINANIYKDIFLKREIGVQSDKKILFLRYQIVMIWSLFCVC